jgi:glycosyltransferase involved in cell wall biosynthesis
MRVVLPLISAAADISGVQRHAMNAAMSILRSSEITRLHLIAGPWQKYVLEAMPAELLRDSRLEIEFCETSNTIVRRNLWYYTQLPRMCRSRAADIVHLAYPMPVHRAAYRVPIVVSLHDLYPYDIPENFGFPKVLFNRSVLWHCLRAVDAIACVSRSTRQRLEQLDRRLVFAKATVIHNSVMPSAAPPIPPKPLNHGDVFLLCIAQHRRNKNILFLLHAFLCLLQSGRITEGRRLVIIGINGPETHAIHRFIQDHALHKEVVLLAGVTEGELQWCYQQCSVLVSPSSVEGFGLPIAEGLLAGSRVVCSDIPAHREIGGSGCCFVPLTTDATQRFANAIAIYAAVPKPSPTALPQLDADAVSSQYLHLYRSLQGTRQHGDHHSIAIDFAKKGSWSREHTTLP